MHNINIIIIKDSFAKYFPRVQQLVARVRHWNHTYRQANQSLCIQYQYDWLISCSRCGCSGQKCCRWSTFSFLKISRSIRMVTNSHGERRVDPSRRDIVSSSSASASTTSGSATASASFWCWNSDHKNLLRWPFFDWLAIGICSSKAWSTGSIWFARNADEMPEFPELFADLWE